MIKKKTTVKSGDEGATETNAHREEKKEKKSFHIMFLRNWKIFGKKKIDRMSRQSCLFPSTYYFHDFHLFICFLSKCDSFKGDSAKEKHFDCGFFFFMAAPWTLNCCCWLVALNIRIGTIFFFYKCINIVFHKFLSLDFILFLFSFLAPCMKVFIWQGNLRTKPINQVGNILIILTWENNTSQALSGSAWEPYIWLTQAF